MKWNPANEHTYLDILNSLPIKEKSNVILYNGSFNLSNMTSVIFDRLKLLWQMTDVTQAKHYQQKIQKFRQQNARAES